MSVLIVCPWQYFQFGSKNIAKYLPILFWGVDKLVDKFEGKAKNAKKKPLFGQKRGIILNYKKSIFVS